MDERPPEKIIIHETIQTILWEDWLSQRKEELARLQGQLCALPNRPTTIDWDINPMARERELLQTIIDPLWKDVRKLKEDNKQLRDVLEKRDKDITEFLVKTQDWMKHYKPLLDKIDEEQKQLKKVIKK
jgi:hypothetical protein